MSAGLIAAIVAITVCAVEGTLGLIKFLIGLLVLLLLFPLYYIGEKIYKRFDKNNSN